LTGKHLVPVVQGQLFKRAGLQHAGVVDQHIAAPMERLHLLGGLLHAEGIGNIAVQHRDIRFTVLRQFGGQLAAFLFVAIKQHTWAFWRTSAAAIAAPIPPAAPVRTQTLESRFSQLFCRSLLFIVISNTHFKTIRPLHWRQGGAQDRSVGRLTRMDKTFNRRDFSTNQRRIAQRADSSLR
jgi:hypothetical protein